MAHRPGHWGTIVLLPTGIAAFIFITAHCYVDMVASGGILRVLRLH